MPRPKKYITEKERLDALKENKRRYQEKEETQLKTKEYNKLYYQRKKNKNRQQDNGQQYPTNNTNDNE